jgi:hypothetical protein
MPTLRFMNPRIILLALLAGAAVFRPGMAASTDTPIQVAHDTNVGLWRVTGARHRLEFNPTNLACRVQTPVVAWRFAASRAGDLEVRHDGQLHSLQLATAESKKVEAYENGFQTGLKIELGGFRSGELRFDLFLQLFLCLEGGTEELVATLIASDGATRVRQCDWPAGLAAESFGTTVVPFMQGMLLPKAWPEKTWLYDTLSFGRGLYQPWWGHEQGGATLLVMLETPDDGGCRFEHPAGGPTQIGPRWVHSLGRFAYPRRARVCFFDAGNYVDLAKRYRRHAIATGRFVSLREKIARNPVVARLIGAPVVHTSILYHIQPESSYYHKDDPAQNHQLVTFAARAKDLQALAAKGVTNAYVHLDGWGLRGYDNLHPDVLPPCPEAGGWEGMRDFAEVCDRLGFLFAIHDQYRDYYLDARTTTDTRSRRRAARGRCTAPGTAGDSPSCVRAWPRGTCARTTPPSSSTASNSAAPTWTSSPWCRRTSATRPNTPSRARIACASAASAWIRSGPGAAWSVRRNPATGRCAIWTWCITARSP